MKKLYVGNLPFSITEDDLRNLFGTYGQVDNVTLMRDRDSGQPRGFGFVEMANDAEADKAMNGTNATDFGGRNLVVNEARPQAPRSFGGGGGGGRGGYGGGGGGGRGGYGGGGGGGGKKGGGGGGRGGNRGGGGGDRGGGGGGSWR